MSTMSFLRRLRSIVSFKSSSTGRDPTVPDLITIFPEENLALPLANGGGFFAPHLGGTLKGGRYAIVRKLGVGQYSTIWLVKDSQNSPPFSYYAAKVLTSAATELHDKGVIQELDIWTSLPAGPRLPCLLDHFYEHTPYGSHLCFVSRLFSIDISAYRRSLPTATIYPFVLKPIVALVTEGLSGLHAANIIHTDIKPTNVLLTSARDDQTIEELLAKEPVELYGIFKRDGQDYPVWASQPLPHYLPAEMTPTIAELTSVSLIDFSHAQRAGQPPTAKVFSAVALRAPELILGGELNKAVDIWAVGCLAFEMLTGKWLFNPKATENCRIEEDHLAQMMAPSGEQFTPDFLNTCALKDDFFTADCSLRRRPLSSDSQTTLESALGTSPTLNPEDIIEAAAFIRSCIRLNPSDRPPAAKLSFHPWLMDAFMQGYKFPLDYDSSEYEDESEDESEGQGDDPITERSGSL